jgi:hypothetical protein
MPVSKEFIQAWRAWRHAPFPYSNKYLQRQSVPTERIEHDLDHMDTYLYGMGLDVIGGRESEYAEIAVRDLAELDRIDAELKSCDVAEDEKEIFRAHMQLMRTLLEEIKNLGSGKGAI